MITTNILSILLITATLAPISWAKSTTTPQEEAEDVCLLKTKYEITQPSDKDTELKPSTQLFKFTAYGLQKLSLNYASGGKSVSDQLLKNSDILNSKSEKMQQFKQNLTKFEEQYKSCDGLDALFKVAEFYSNTTSFYYELEEDASLDDDSKLILGLLRKYKSVELDTDFEKFFDEFVENFDKKFTSLKENLSKEESKESKKLLEWFAHFKTLKEYEDKIVAFEKYFDLYD